MRIGVTGYKGRLGSALVRKGLEPCYADITVPDSVKENTDGFDVIINCAAYTFVDGAEDNYSHALKVNSTGVRTLFQNFRGRIIHTSTDYVFDGKSGPYDEHVKFFSPVNSYGFSKLGGEMNFHALRKHRDTLIRTTGLYGSIGVDLATVAYEALSRKYDFPGITDLYANQTYIPHLVEALIVLAKEEVRDIPVIHLASRDICSRYEFIRKIAIKMGVSPKYVIPATADKIVGWKAKRPVNGGLKTRMATLCGLPIYSIAEGLDEWFKKV